MAWILATAIALAVTALASPGGRAALRWLDVQLLDEALKDASGRWWHREDWQAAPALPRGLDASWLREAGRPVLIAHALGEAGQAGQNTLDAMRRSHARGLRLMEVDIWLDDRGELRCHHGPARPDPMRPGDCTLPPLARAAAGDGSWLVLDLKTEFRATGEAILRALDGQPGVARLVFQLYQPADVAAFAEWSTRHRLPAPIVTAYQAHRSVRHVARHAERIGAVALAVPLQRAQALGPLPPSVVLMVHPIKDCDGVRRATQLSARGLYVMSALVPEVRAGCPP
jgi:hypothetical protein